MSSWLIVIVLTLLLIVTSGMLILSKWDIKKMTKQLDEINNNFGTNELVRTNTHNKAMMQFTEKINQLIGLFKQDQQLTERREIELRQEITNISHDLRTPLTSIKGFSELLSDPSLSHSEREEYVAIIQKKIDHLTMVVDLFYELSQLDSSDKQLVLDKQDLKQIVIEKMLMFYDEFDKKQLNVQMEEATVSPVFADKKATNRIVTNIIQNALTYAQHNVTIRLQEEENDVWLIVVNDAEKINKSELERIFDRTFRLDSSRAGTQLGLGLHIVQQLVDMQGGKAAVEVYNNEFMIKVGFKKYE